MKSYNPNDKHLAKDEVKKYYPNLQYFHNKPGHMYIDLHVPIKK